MGCWQHLRFYEMRIMKCKKCGGKTQVTDTEESLDGFAELRRRQCQSCGYRFKTIENFWEDIRTWKNDSFGIPRKEKDR